MIIEKGGWIRLVYTIFLSISIYISVTLWFSEDIIMLDMIIKSALLGISIWLIAEILFSITQKLWPHKNIAGYVALILIIAVGTSFGSMLLGFKDTTVLILIIITAEIFGNGISLIYQYIYKQQLNKSLKNYQEDKLN